mmetsp:Transcript_70666/g.169311  ORF Transcript_70666/g.169311 Transcript_70666/m.169311 type:complete len:131 (+) Transcript_70666:1-393(+)
MGATSYINSARLKRPPTLPTYTAWVSGGGDAKLLIGEPDLEEESDEGVGGDEAVWDEVVEVFMVGLRMRQGLSIHDLKARFPAAFIDRALLALRPHQDRGLVETTKGGRVRLTTPDGFLFSNTVLVSLFE